MLISSGRAAASGKRKEEGREMKPEGTNAVAKEGEFWGKKRSNHGE